MTIENNQDLPDIESDNKDLISAENTQPDAIKSQPGNQGYAPIKAEYVIPMESRKIIVQTSEGHGMNKKRDFSYIKETGEYALCQRTARGEPCTGANCKREHDIDTYMKTKHEPLGDQCPVFMEYGKCNYGVMCAFYKQHTTDALTQLECTPRTTLEPCNRLSRDVQIAIRKKTYVYNRKKTMDTTGDAADVVETTEERRHPRTVVDFCGKSYLAPLTTVGNLPFRRLCKDMGVDITCGEMAMAEELLKCSPSEWALLRRHPSEDVFGVQICGNNADVMTRAVQLLNNEISADFIDINMGCPIEMVFKRGYGSGMFNRAKKMEHTIQQLCNVSTIPITTKFRNGIVTGKNIAHDYIAKFKEYGVIACTLHGRSRQQRYQKLADWDYIYEVIIYICCI